MHVCRHIYICIHMYVYEYMCQHMLPSWFWHYVLPLVVWDSSMLVTCFALRCVFVGMSAWLFGSAVKHFGKTKCKCVPQMGRIYVTQNDNKINPKAIFKHHGPLITLWLHVATVSLLQEAFLQQRYECPRSMEAERMIFWMAAACA